MIHRILPYRSLYELICTLTSSLANLTFRWVLLVYNHKHNVLTLHRIHHYNGYQYYKHIKGVITKTTQVHTLTYPLYLLKQEVIGVTSFSLVLVILRRMVIRMLSLSSLQLTYRLRVQRSQISIIQIMLHLAMLLQLPWMKLQRL